MAIENCSGCRFYVPANRAGQDNNECHHNPPITPGKVGDSTGWPRVYPGDWCGQWVRAARKDVRRVEGDAEGRALAQ